MNQLRNASVGPGVLKNSPAQQLDRGLAVLRGIALGATFVLTGIHLALAPDHLEEKLYIGVLFVIGSGLLCLVAAGLASDRDRLRAPAWALGSVVSAVMFIAFVVSRAAGLPKGDHEAWAGGPRTCSAWPPCSSSWFSWPARACR